MVKRWVAFLLVFLCSVVMITAVSAHAAQLVESSPGNGDILEETPSEIFARFDEEIVYPDSWIKVYNSSGEQVDEGDGGVDLNNSERDSLIIYISLPLPDDVYTVEWHVMLLDGDVTEDAFTFTIGSPNIVEDSPSNATSFSNMLAWVASGIGLLLLIVLIFIMWRNKVY